MKYEEMLKNMGHQFAMALNENDAEKRSEHKYNLLEQLEYLIEFSKGRDTHCVDYSGVYRPVY